MAAEAAGSDGAGSGGFGAWTGLALWAVLSLPFWVAWWRAGVGRASLLCPGREGMVRRVPGPMWAAGFFLVQLAGLIGLALASAVDESPSGRWAPAVMFGVSTAAAIGAWAWVLRAWPGSAERGRLRRGLAMAGVGAVIAVLSWPVLMCVSIASLIIWHALGQEPPAVAHATLVSLRSDPDVMYRVVTIAVAVVAAPVMEEIVYRGFVQSGLGKLAGLVGAGRWAGHAAVVATSGLFTLMHVGAAEPHALPTLFVLSLVLGVAYERTGRMVVPIAAHAVFNAANTALALLM